MSGSSELLPDLGVFQAKDQRQALDAALALVQTYCGWHIAPSLTTSVAVWSPDGNVVFLPTLNLTAVSSVVQGGVTLGASTYNFERYGAVRVDPTATAYFRTDQRVTVDFTHGYATLPSDVKDTVLYVAQRILTDTRGLVPRVTGGPAFMENRGPRLEEFDKERLNAYSITGGFA